MPCLGPATPTARLGPRTRRLTDTSPEVLGDAVLVGVGAPLRAHAVPVGVGVVAGEARQGGHCGRARGALVRRAAEASGARPELRAGKEAAPRRLPLARHCLAQPRRQPAPSAIGRRCPARNPAGAAVPRALVEDAQDDPATPPLRRRAPPGSRSRSGGQLLVARHAEERAELDAALRPQAGACGEPGGCGGGARGESQPGPGS